MEVLKRDGTKEEFKVEKLEAGIKKSLANAKIVGQKNKEERDKIVALILKELKDKNLVESSQLRNDVLLAFHEKEKEAEQAWLKYEK